MMVSVRKNSKTGYYNMAFLRGKYANGNFEI